MFSTVIVYLIISPAPLTLSPSSITLASFVTLMEASEVIFVTVGSFVGSVSKSGPSKSSFPSSETSLTSSVFPGLDPVAVTVLINLPLSASSSVIV